MKSVNESFLFMVNILLREKYYKRFAKGGRENS
jgi:hypothetical protein